MLSGLYLVVVDRPRQSVGEIAAAVKQAAVEQLEVPLAVVTIDDADDKVSRRRAHS